MPDPLEIARLADDFKLIQGWLQASEHDCLKTSFSFTEAGVAAVVREFPSAQKLANEGKDSLMSRGVSELNAVLLCKIAGVYSGAPIALLY
jgi:hypothetical protein